MSTRTVQQVVFETGELPLLQMITKALHAFVQVNIDLGQRCMVNLVDCLRSIMKTH